MNYIEDIVVTIRRKNLDNFQGESTGSTCWFIFDRWWLKETLSELEPYFYKNLLKSNIEGQDIETYKTALVLFDENKFT